MVTFQTAILTFVTRAEDTSQGSLSGIHCNRPHPNYRLDKLFRLDASFYI
jgi:hypothetical protein